MLQFNITDVIIALSLIYYIWSKEYNMLLFSSFEDCSGADNDTDTDSGDTTTTNPSGMYYISII